MLVLFETPAGFALFKVLDEGKLSSVEVLNPLPPSPHPCGTTVRAYGQRCLFCLVDSSLPCFWFAGSVEGLCLVGQSKKGGMIHGSVF